MVNYITNITRGWRQWTDGETGMDTVDYTILYNTILRPIPLLTLSLLTLLDSNFPGNSLWA